MPGSNAELSIKLNFLPHADRGAQVTTQDSQGLSLSSFPLKDHAPSSGKPLTEYETHEVDDMNHISADYVRVLRDAVPLTDEQNAYLDTRILEGLDAQEKLDTKRLSTKQQKDLKRIIQLGREARSMLIQPNLRLVVSVVKKFRGRGVGFMDLIQSGNVGLVHASDIYTPKRAKFSTLAVWWIRQSAGRDVANVSRAIRLPINLGWELSKILKIKSTLTNALDREPTLEELAKEFTAYKISTLLLKGKPIPTNTEEYYDLQLKRIKRIIKAEAMQPVSLHEHVNGDEGLELQDTLVDPNSTTIEDALYQRSIVEAIQERTRDLYGEDKTDLMLFLRRSGLLSGESIPTLRTIAQEQGISRETVRLRAHRGKYIAIRLFGDLISH